jgi:hypothetical protein
MFCFSQIYGAFLVGVLVVPISLGAQTAAYHVELTNGTTGRAVFVNDSDKLIEAFHLSTMCEAGGGGASEDYLSTGDRVSIGGPEGRGPDGRTLFQGLPLKRGERFVSAQQVSGNPNAQRCRVVADAVIFSDGSHEGEEWRVRALQSGRDGTAAAVRYWIGREGKADAASLIADAKAHKQEDSAGMQRNALEQYRNHDAAAAWQYWAARLTVDTVVASMVLVDLGNKDSSGWQFLTGWMRRIDGDASLKKLDAVFPLQAELAQR